MHVLMIIQIISRQKWPINACFGQKMADGQLLYCAQVAMYIRN